MGTLYINGKPLDTGENNSPRLERCDQCETLKSITGGRTIYSSGYSYDELGEAIAWICADCLRS
jgi:hypothetical protein